MLLNSNVKEKLEKYKVKDKFSDAAWERRGLIPSDYEVSKQMREAIDSCIDKLLLKEDVLPKGMKKLIAQSIKETKATEYDTEEREFLADCFQDIAKIIDVDIKDDLNKWLYGSLMAAMVKIKEMLIPERVIEVHSQSCTSCNVDLETYILKKQNGIPDFAWFIIQCNNCDECNLLSLGENIKESKKGNYEYIGQLPKDQYTEEQAWNRLDQINSRRK